MCESFLVKDPPHYRSPRENLNVHSWAWKDELEDSPKTSTQQKFPPVAFTENNRNVLFHWGWSSGTAAVRGDLAFTSGNSYYWEIQMHTAPYGTDVMVGVGTADVQLSLSGMYVSLLGLNKDSWGFSYTGKFQHDGCVLLDYGTVFGDGDVVGLHLDMWFGSLTFFVNGIQMCVVNDKTLTKQTLYPMMCSSSASMCLQLIYSYSSSNLLQKMCLERLESDNHAMNVVSKIPGLSKECVKRFLDAKDTEKTPDKHSSELSELEDGLDVISDTSSSDELYEFSIPRKRLSRLLKYATSKECAKCGKCPQPHITRSLASRLCSICFNDTDIDIYDGM